jgi:hypothetical protein
MPALHHQEISMALPMLDPETIERNRPVLRQMRAELQEMKNVLARLQHEAMLQQNSAINAALTRWAEQRIAIARQRQLAHHPRGLGDLDHLGRRSGFDPNQPRVSAGNPDGGQWTRVGNGRTAEDLVRVAMVGGRYLPPPGQRPPLTAGQVARYMDAMRRFFEALDQIRKTGDDWAPHAPSLTATDSNEGYVAIAEAIAGQAEDKVRSIAQSQLQQNHWRPPPGRQQPPWRTERQHQPPQLPGIGHNMGPRLNDAASSNPQHWLQLYRIVRNGYDLLGYPTWSLDKGTVAVTTVDQMMIYGVSSKTPGYTKEDDREAKKMREILLAKHRDVMNTDDIGSIKNQSVFHAETTILLRIAKELRKRGRAIAGRVLA